MQAQEIIEKYIEFFEGNGHKRIPNSSLVPLNDPTTLFTSAGMQPLVPYLLGEKHPEGTKLVNVQNCFRAQDIDEIGDNRHTTFFRMLGNWSLGDYFKSEQIPWFFEFLTDRLNIPAEKLYVTVFEGNDSVPKDTESEQIWKRLFEERGLNAKERIFYYGTDKNWWSRAGAPDKMPSGEPGGPSTEVFYEFTNIKHDKKFGEQCHVNCDCGRFLEIGNSVFMAYKKQDDGSIKPLASPNVDFGGGLERLIMATEDQNDAFSTSLLKPLVETIENTTAKNYDSNKKEMRVVADHLTASTFIISNGIKPSNKEQGYVLRRLLRRAFDNFYLLNGDSITSIVDKIVDQYSQTDPDLKSKYEEIKNTILTEEEAYKRVLTEAKKFINKRYKKTGDELMGVTEISAEDAFTLYTTHGLSPTQIKSLGFTFNDQEFARKMEEHSSKSRTASAGKFKGGLADHEEQTIKGHTATHLLQQALRDVLGDSVHQTGSNITTERLRFDFKYDKKLTDDELKRVEEIVNEKIKENLPVHFEMMPVAEAKATGAIGLFDDKYQENVKVYFIGPLSGPREDAYSKEFCGGPHVDFTGKIKKFRIIKEESLGKENRRIYAIAE
ncbi:MAG TPA: alanine--tRNA ligase [Patescibacteria group bacterium]|nr:alanine--tRNA ligase [Patescibacteria group bacterium]